MRRVIAGGICAVVLAAPAAGQVKVRLQSDGTRLIYNESPAQHARRVAPRLVPMPDATLDQVIERHSAAKGLDPRLVRSVIQVESGYNARARSHKGAMGLMQLMPETARLLAVDDPWSSDQNVRGGTSYLRQLLDRFDQDLDLALAGYNAGPAAVERYRGIPPYAETRGYVEKVLRIYRGDDSYSLPPASSFAPAGRKTYVLRTPEDRIVISTSPAL